MQKAMCQKQCAKINVYFELQAILSLVADNFYWLFISCALSVTRWVLNISTDSKYGDLCCYRDPCGVKLKRKLAK